MSMMQPARRLMARAARAALTTLAPLTLTLMVLPCLIAALPLEAQAQAQTPAKPAARPAAAPASAASARGFGTARGPLLTRDELRACLAQEDDLKKRVERLDSTRAPLEQDKKVIADEQVALRAERTKLEGTEPAVAAFTERTKAFTDRLAKWNERVKAFSDSGRSGAAAEREREALNVERAELEKERAALETERERLQAARGEAVQAYNAKVAALDPRITEWKKREAAYNEAALALEGERTAWVASCGNRRYREEDEIAIRSGK